MTNKIANAAEPTIPNTVAIQKSLELIEDDLSGTIDGWFGEIDERLTDIQEILRSAALRTVLKELAKLRTVVVEKLQASVLDARTSLELHDCEVSEALESIDVQEAVEVEDAA